MRKKGDDKADSHKGKEFVHPHFLSTHLGVAHQTWRHASSGGEGELSFIPLKPNISPIYIHAHIKMKTKEIKKSLVDI